MKYAISIDWLALYCSIDSGSFARAADLTPEPFRKRPFIVKKEPYGTRQFAELHKVTLNDEEFCEIQSNPYSGILRKKDCIVRVVNRQLYRAGLFYDLQTFFDEFGIAVQGISRCDLCADFNRFKCYECIPFISDFLAGKIRHKGRGKGAAYFDHGSVKVGPHSQAYVKYSGLSFGSNESDCRVYLYNKTFELQSVKDKPYIRDLWKKTGLDLTKDVWRLEVSLKGKAKKFKDKISGMTIEVQKKDLEDDTEVCKLFHTFVRKYFAFVVNRPNITNITREPLLQLFDDNSVYIHQVLRYVSSGNRTERILIKQLWQMSETYRGMGLHTDEDITREMAVSLAEGTDLMNWFREKKSGWSKPTRK